MIYELNKPSIAAPVFADWEDLDAGVIACLDNVMGKILVTDPDHPKSALAVIGDFAFCAGEPDLELLRGKPDRWMIVVPQDEAWEELIENNFPAYKRIRYALKKDTVFDREKLEAMAKAEIKNAESAIPLVDADSRLGWEPSMEYVTDRWHIEWKIRQVNYMLGEIKEFRDLVNLQI